MAAMGPSASVAKCARKATASSGSATPCAANSFLSLRDASTPLCTRPHARPQAGKFTAAAAAAADDSHVELDLPLLTFSCIVGIKLSQATYYLRSQDMVATLLAQMADHSAQDAAARLQLAEQLASQAPQDSVPASQDLVLAAQASQDSVLAEEAVEAVEPLTTDV
mmetsp:Transcript_21266/g.63500  ORF Transcript_21266/g.63500 Transcript_21266/m.63500 type:complete len:166 (+) Transcript_21266:185-682(+)